MILKKNGSGVYVLNHELLPGVNIILAIYPKINIAGVEAVMSINDSVIDRWYNETVTLDESTKNTILNWFSSKLYYLDISSHSFYTRFMNSKCNELIKLEE